MKEGWHGGGGRGRLGYPLLRDFFFQEEGSIDFCKRAAYLLGNMRGFQGGRRFWRGLKEGVIGEWGLAGSGARRPPLRLTSRHLPRRFRGSGSAQVSVSQFCLFEDDYFESHLDRTRNSHFFSWSYEAHLTPSHL